MQNLSVYILIIILRFKIPSIAKKSINGVRPWKIMTSYRLLSAWLGYWVWAVAIQKKVFRSRLIKTIDSLNIIRVPQIRIPRSAETPIISAQRRAWCGRLIKIFNLLNISIIARVFSITIWQTIQETEGRIVWNPLRIILKSNCNISVTKLKLLS